MVLPLVVGAGLGAEWRTSSSSTQSTFYTVDQSRLSFPSAGRSVLVLVLVLVPVLALVLVFLLVLVLISGCVSSFMNTINDNESNYQNSV